MENMETNYELKFTKIFFEMCKEKNYIKIKEFLELQSQAERKLYINWLNNYALRQSQSDLEMVMYLVENGADIHVNDDSVLSHACFYGDIDAVKYLISKGANVHAWNNKPLRWACQEGHLEVVKYLTTVGADIHNENNWAIRFSSIGSIDVVEYLISIGAKYTLDCIELAKHHNKKEIVSRLENLCM